ncbi:hypothetical protein CLOACE_19760 [Clostridium acetireducens DSM 10703]|uniref:Uncharacterized protein n=1 Tax=Clostridium acetireducens DSM 10703 TaxID=1121290 RepID=A0A1E8EWI8_9CLOT|nr:hypothetical protein [Clostridium acetireducens]OFI05007.1 hypothetical protein CLOACE_19760 [Clostridium acetireducens DSM 10703]
MDEKEKFDFVYDNYKESFKLCKEAQIDRNKFFFIIVVLTAFLFLMTIYPTETIATFQSFIKTKMNIEVKFNFFVIQSIIWFLLLYYTMQYYQKNIYVERQYGYLADIEDVLSTKIHRTLNREGKNYLKSYPLYSDFIDWIYKFGFPLISITLIVVKISNEWIYQNHNLGIIFDSIIALFIIILTILYMLFLHQNFKLSIWVNMIYGKFKNIKK